MSTPPAEPTEHRPPTRVAPGTYLIHEVQHALGQPLSVYMNSLVIQGREPVIVDTGSVRNRRSWLEDVFGLVDPADVRWVFLSHDDADHTGNLGEVMAACPRAELVCSWALTERFANAFDFPLERCRWVNDGDAFDAGDRTLVALRPPTYDSPATRGLLDHSTGVYWAADAFATPVPGGDGATSLAADVADLDADFWWNGMVMFGLHALSPWVSLVDADRFSATVDRVAQHRPATIVSAHSPAITGAGVDQVLALTRRLPGATPPPPPDQVALDDILAAAVPT
ncbi:MAG TPA: MBL fold metallo-hydrolase [Acidimicrobiales bacterium]